MIPRELSAKALLLAAQFPVVVCTGPRQSGKTTLVKSAFGGKPYVSLEDHDMREYARTDPRGLLAQYGDGAIFDEIQHVPELLSYVQTNVDADGRCGRFILTGSHNILLQQGVSQSLAGRAAYVELLPLSIGEITAANIPAGSAAQSIVRGQYPRIVAGSAEPADFYPNYVRTYVERDVRAVKNITDLRAFGTFLRLCAGRVGQLLNLSSLAIEAGVTHQTIRSWLGILEASYIVYLLQPLHAVISKRLIKIPKLYFYDTGLAAYLLGLRSAEQTETHYLRGELFENLVVTEMIKSRLNKGLQPDLSFFRDKTGNEVDIIAEWNPSLAVEIKASATPSDAMFKGLRFLGSLLDFPPERRYVVYSGEQTQPRTAGTLVGWEHSGKIGAG